jgi:hypothetical protein
MPAIIASRRLDQELQREAKDAAARAGVSFAAFTRAGLREMLALEEAEVREKAEVWESEPFYRTNRDRITGRARELLEELR